MSNWASEYANEIETRSDVRQQRKQSRAQERARKKALDERDILFRLWKKWHEERKTQLLEGEHKEAAQELADFLERMTLEDAPALLTLVENGPWRNSGRDVKFLVLELIDHGITYLRESTGLNPFDDPLPFSNEELNVFLSIRELLR